MKSTTWHVKDLFQKAAVLQAPSFDKHFPSCWCNISVIRNQAFSFCLHDFPKHFGMKGCTCLLLLFAMSRTSWGAMTDHGVTGAGPLKPSILKCL